MYHGSMVFKWIEFLFFLGKSWLHFLILIKFTLFSIILTELIFWSKYFFSLCRQNGGRRQKKSNAKWHWKGSKEPKIVALHTNCETQSFLLGFSWSSDQGILALIILQWATRKTHPWAYQCIWGYYIIFAQKI